MTSKEAATDSAGETAVGSAAEPSAGDAGTAVFRLRGITKVAAVELGRYGVRVNAVCPEAGGPEMVRPYLPEGLDPELAMSFQWPILHTQRDRSVEERLEDIALLVTYLASDESRSCTGGDFVIDGGHSAGRLVKGGPTS